MFSVQIFSKDCFFEVFVLVNILVTVFIYPLKMEAINKKEHTTFDAYIVPSKYKTSYIIS